MSTGRGRVLVVGATGLLGGVVARVLRTAGVLVPALARDAGKLRALEALGAEPVALDLQDAAAVRRACDDVDQIVASANNHMGSGATSPSRVDEPAYRNLCAAARPAGGA